MKEYVRKKMTMAFCVGKMMEGVLDAIEQTVDSVPEDVEDAICDFLFASKDFSNTYEWWQTFQELGMKISEKYPQNCDKLKTYIKEVANLFR